MFDTTQGQHFRTVFRRHHMPNRFAIRINNIAFMTKVPVGVDFDFDAAVAENTLGDNGHHIHTVVVLADNKRGGFVIGIGCARTNCCHKRPLAFDNIAVPTVHVSTLHEGDQFLIGALDNGQWIKADQVTVVIGIAITST